MTAARISYPQVFRAAAGFLALGFCLIGAPAAVTFAAAGELRLLTFNVKIDNRAYERLSDFVASVHPDIVVLQEAGKPWLYKTILSRFPYRQFGPGHLVVASWLAFVEEPERQLHSPRGLKGVVQRVLISTDGSNDPSTAIAVYNIHPASPRSKNGLQRQIDDFGSIARLMASEPPTRIIIAAGDFNAVPAFPVFARFRATTGLELLPSETLPTPARFPMEFGLPIWLGVAIDHITARGAVTLINRTVGPDLGSDHRPVVADIVVKPPHY